jgi:hypothetical protein
MHVERILLSNSSNGRNIKVAATATPGTLIHTAVAGPDDLDEIYVYAANTDTSARLLTIEFGGTASPDDLIEVSLEPEKGPYLIIPGWALQNGAEVRAFAASANVVVVNGYVNRIYQV